MELASIEVYADLSRRRLDCLYILHVYKWEGQGLGSLCKY